MWTHPSPIVWNDVIYLPGINHFSSLNCVQWLISKKKKFSVKHVKAVNPLSHPWFSSERVFPLGLRSLLQTILFPNLKKVSKNQENDSASNVKEDFVIKKGNIWCLFEYKSQQIRIFVVLLWRENNEFQNAGSCK